MSKMTNGNECYYYIIIITETGTDYAAAKKKPSDYFSAKKNTEYEIKQSRKNQKKLIRFTQD